MGELDEMHQIDALVQDKKKSRITSAQPERRPMPAASSGAGSGVGSSTPGNNQKKPRKSSRADLKVGRVQSAVQNVHPSKS